MNDETKLRLQAWVDGELPPKEAAEVDARLRADPEAQALVAELRHTRAALGSGEAAVSVPMPRELYWSGIERQIRLASEHPTPSPSWREFSGLWRWLAPVGLAALLGVLTLSFWDNGGQGRGLLERAEIESPLDDISSITFRSDTEGMTIVWVDAR